MGDLGHDFVLRPEDCYVQHFLGLAVEVGSVGLELADVVFNLGGLATRGQRGRLFLLPGFQAVAEFAIETEDPSLGLEQFCLLLLDQSFLLLQEFLELLIGVCDVV